MWLRSPSAAAFQRAETILSVDWIEIEDYWEGKNGLAGVFL